jgi:hypothetical protein
MTIADASPAFETIEPTLEDEYFSRIAGALIGSAAADALGWITEFVRGPEHMRKIYRSDRVTEYRSWQKATGGRFNTYIDYISAGQYSDDTQLTLAVARSLQSDGSVDVHHLAKVEFPLWLDYARGAGSTITGAARALQRRSANWNSNFFTYKHRGATQDYRDAGANGAAMRVAPVALANVNDQERMVMAILERFWVLCSSLRQFEAALWRGLRSKRTSSLTSWTSLRPPRCQTMKVWTNGESAGMRAAVPLSTSGSRRRLRFLEGSRSYPVFGTLPTLFE